MTIIKSMNKINHSWKGKVEINGIEYHWEQFATSSATIKKVVIINPIQMSFEFEPQISSLGHAIALKLKMLNHRH